MGTRHLILVVVDGEYKLAQYGQYDGYPEYRGMKILDFLKNEFNEQAFRNNLKKCRFLSAEEIENLQKPYSDRKESDKFFEDYPQFDCTTASGVLGQIQNTADGVGLENSLTFAADGLFCEWVWVIDLDKRTFEGYEGFNKKKLNTKDRFYFLEKFRDENTSYHPAKLIDTWDLDNLPTNEDFLKAFSHGEDE